jgi:hypothetical protein
MIFGTGDGHPSRCKVQSLGKGQRLNRGHVFAWSSKMGHAPCLHPGQPIGPNDDQHYQQDNEVPEHTPAGRFLFHTHMIS